MFSWVLVSLRLPFKILSRLLWLVAKFSLQTPCVVCAGRYGTGEGFTPGGKKMVSLPIVILPYVNTGLSTSAGEYNYYSPQ